MELKEAEKIAYWLIDYLAPGCERIAISGSVRRRKADVGDIELIVVPMDKIPRPKFGQKNVDLSEIDRLLRHLCEDRKLWPVKNGSKYKQFKISTQAFGLPESLNPFCLDLFLVTPPSQWGVEFMIRTGPSDFSRWMVTQQSKGGALPDGYFVRHNVVWREGTPVPKRPEQVGDLLCNFNAVLMEEEVEYFRLCELPYLEPNKRLARWRFS